MGGTESKEREALKAAYPGKKWQQRVVQMSDQQVIAVYFRLKKQNKI